MPRLAGTSPLSGLIARIRSLWRGLRRRADIEAEMAEEFRHHLELRTEDLVRQGLSPQEAARRARIEFGHIDSHKEDARASRGLWLFDQIRFSWLDVKLGLRMMVKYPGLSLISVVGMAVAIAVGAGGFQFIGSMMSPELPLAEGDRVVSLQNNTRNPGNPERRVLHDFLVWRDELRSVRELSAFVDGNRNLVTASGAVVLVSVAEMTASGFAVARVKPLLGRTLLEEDEQPGAPPVVVIGYGAWRRHFDGDPAVLGRQVRLGAEHRTVVGVMPEGFGFPINHGYWVPLRPGPAAQRTGEGPEVYIFGRLADGATLESAQAELATIGRRMAAAYPETHEFLRPRVMRYAHAFFDADSPGMAWVMRGFQFALGLLLVVVAVNVAILVYARTAARAGEIAVRTALGASRRRVVAQLFVEAFVLSGIAAVIGLVLAATALALTADFLLRESDESLPFWMDLGLSPTTILFTAGLAVLAGVIIGVLPGLKATGRGMHEGLKQLSARGSQMQLGRTWSALIVVQVAVAVAALPFAVYMAGVSVQRGVARPGYAVDEVLQARISLERDEAVASADTGAYRQALEARFLDRGQELMRRLEAEPAVAAVTFASHRPGAEGYGRVEVEGTGARLAVRVSRVEVEYFGDMGVPVLAGRGFVGADSVGGPSAVVVDRVFVERVLGGGNALGRRIRQLTWRGAGDQAVLEEGPWLEVVGVVPDFAVQPDFDPADPKMYLPAPLAHGNAAVLSVRVPGDAGPGRFAARLREITTAVSPDLALLELRTAAEAERQTRKSLLGLAVVVVAVIGSVLLLSAAGIYAMMSFTVVRRRREIGIRVALGADRRRVLSGIFARAGAQLGSGVLAGLVIAGALDRAMGGGPFSGRGVLLLPLVAVIVLAIGLLAALGPTRRGLAVQPTEALREE